MKSIDVLFTLGREYHDIPVKAFEFPETDDHISDYATLLKETNVTTASWNTDTDFSDDVNISWAFGNQHTARIMSNELLAVNDSTHIKWVYTTLMPFQSNVNQFGLTISEVSWDGSVYAPMVSTQVLNMNPLLSSPVLENNNSAIAQYSTSTLTPNLVVPPEPVPDLKPRDNPKNPGGPKT
jgi:hypothetical protein